MLRCLSVVLLSLVFINNLQAQKKSEQYKKFLTDIKALGLTFEMPEGFKEVAVIENRNVYYNHAIQSPDGKLEVRYTIFPLEPYKAAYEASLETDPEDAVPHNEIFQTMIYGNVMAMQGSTPANGLPKVTQFSDSLVQADYKADKGAFARVWFNSDFGKNWRLGTLVGLHKDDVADVYITFLYDNKQYHDTYADRCYTSLRFKK